MLFLKKSFFSYHVNHDSNDEGHQNYKNKFGALYNAPNNGKNGNTDRVSCNVYI